jgi:hypothetical protein
VSHRSTIRLGCHECNHGLSITPRGSCPKDIVRIRQNLSSKIAEGIGRLRKNGHGGLENIVSMSTVAEPKPGDDDEH